MVTTPTAGVNKTDKEKMIRIFFMIKYLLLYWGHFLLYTDLMIVF